MKLSIVEDEVLIADHLREIVEGGGFEVVDIANTQEEALQVIQNDSDVYLLDIRLGEGNDGEGINLGSKLQERSKPFIYITANNEIDILKKAVHTKPAAYITKPFKERDVLAALELLKIQQEDRTVKLSTLDGKVNLNLDDVLYCEASDVYVVIYSKKGKLTIRTTLKEFEQLLNDDFVRIHRSFIVNKHHVDYRKTDKAIIKGIEIPISRSYRNVL